MTTALHLMPAYLQGVSCAANFTLPMKDGGRDRTSCKKPSKMVSHIAQLVLEEFDMTIMNEMEVDRLTVPLSVMFGEFGKMNGRSTRYVQCWYPLLTLCRGYVSQLSSLQKVLKKI